MTQKIISFFLLVALLPVFLVVSIFILLSSKGGIFFMQERVGKNFKKFHIIKFRTMKLGAYDSNKYIKSEPLNEITGVGKFLRLSSLDELPQLINILKGDMAFIGPRPVVPVQLLSIKKCFHNRFDVLPGITGFAQIEGRRIINWNEQLEKDLLTVDFIRSKKFSAIVKIIVKTFFSVLAHNNIYASKNTINWRDCVNSEDNLYNFINKS